jgi:acyl-coenzyme A synthetase/AMP-(fatty) acid ligase
MINANFYATFERCALNASQPALETATGHTCTYADLNREVARCAAALRISD